MLTSYVGPLTQTRIGISNVTVPQENTIKSYFFVCFIILIIIYMISNDITISLNELFKYFDTVNVSGFRRDTSPAFFGTSMYLHVYS